MEVGQNAWGVRRRTVSRAAFGLFLLQRQKAALALIMALNYTSSIAIVFLNKLAYQQSFPSATLTLLHFVATFAGLQVGTGVGKSRGERPGLRSRGWFGGGLTRGAFAKGVRTGAGVSSEMAAAAGRAAAVARLLWLCGFQQLVADVQHRRLLPGKADCPMRAMNSPPPYRFVRREASSPKSWSPQPSC